MYHGRKIWLSADLMLVQTARTTQQLLEEFWTLTDWLPYLPDWHVLQAKVQAMPHPIWQPYIRTEYIQKTCHSSAAATKLSLWKMKFKFNKWLSNSLTHQPVLFRATVSCNKTWRPIYWKNTVRPWWIVPPLRSYCTGYKKKFQNK